MSLQAVPQPHMTFPWWTIKPEHHVEEFYVGQD